MTQERPLFGIALMLGFCVTAPLIDVFSKLAVETQSVGLVTFARFVGQGLIMLPVMLILGHGLRLPAALLPGLVLRALFLAVSTFAFVSAVVVMPIADALAIVFVEPFILLLWGRFVLSEAVGPRRLIASLIGFAGVLLVIQPSFQRFGLIALWPLATAASFAFYILITRSLSSRMHPVPMQFHTSWLAALICLPPLFWPGTGDFAMAQPQGIVWLWLAGVGLASAIAHMMMTVALRNASSTLLAPLHYLELVSAVIFGWLIWRDFPNPLAWAGIMVVIGSGLYIIHRERVTASAARRQATAEPAAK